MKKKRVIRILLLVFILLIIYIIVGFTRTELEVTPYTYTDNKLPAEFDGYKIVQISDLHHKNFGENQETLINAIRNENPNIILLTGDMVDKNHTDMKPVEDFIKGAVEIAPVYSVTGNHELDPKAKEQCRKLMSLYNEYGVHDIDDYVVEISVDGASILLHGQSFKSYHITEDLPYADQSAFNILLYHCSDYFDLISEYGYDMVFSGHTHGGIVRLPFIGGVFGNSGDFFPEYDAGIFIENDSTLFSNRGLGDAKVPRFYNPPEIVSVTLKCN